MRNGLPTDGAPKDPDEVDRIVHDKACVELRLFPEIPGGVRVCVDTCAVADQADVVMTRAELDDLLEGDEDR